MINLQLKTKYKVGICGHFGGTVKSYDGQTIKTKIFTTEIINVYGSNMVKCLDTYGWGKNIFSILSGLIELLIKCKNVIIFPGKNGLLLFAPVLAILNPFYSRKLHYVVIGGWLPEYLSKKKWLIPILKKFEAVYVETASMKKKLECLGVNNTVVIPNCKELNILQEHELKYRNEEPYKLCTFSRVMKEKGIQLAVEAVKLSNKKIGKVVFSLDIYGQVDENQIEWFENMKSNFPNYIHYCGLVSYEQSTNVLKQYYALLFPTFYEGEGFAGTLIDALAAGVPVLASNWKYNSEIVQTGKTGRIIKNQLEDELIDIYHHSQEWNSLKSICLNEAKKYQPPIAMRELIERLK
jgi:glycosyltransferase involved in cell wall biosynthesis